SFDETGAAVRQRGVQRRAVVDLAAGGRGIQARGTVARVAATGSHKIVGERREVVSNVNAAALQFEQGGRPERVRVVTRDHGVMAVFDRLRLDGCGSAGRGAATENVVVPCQIAGVVLTEPEVALDERLGRMAPVSVRRVHAYI